MRLLFAVLVLLFSALARADGQEQIRFSLNAYIEGLSDSIDQAYATGLGGRPLNTLSPLEYDAIDGKVNQAIESFSFHYFADRLNNDKQIDQLLASLSRETLTDVKFSHLSPVARENIWSSLGHILQQIHDKGSWRDSRAVLQDTGKMRDLMERLEVIRSRILKDPPKNGMPSESARYPEIGRDQQQGNHKFRRSVRELVEFNWDQFNATPLNSQIPADAELKREWSKMMGFYQRKDLSYPRSVALNLKFRHWKGPDYVYKPLRNAQFGPGRVDSCPQFFGVLAEATL